MVQLMRLVVTGGATQCCSAQDDGMEPTFFSRDADRGIV